MVTSGFYNSINEDRPYDAIQMSSIFDGIINDGIFGSYGAAFDVTPGGALSVLVDTGRAWFNHTWTLNDTLLPLVCEQAELILPRIDAVVIEVDARNDVRANSIKIIKGTPSLEPLYPTLLDGTNPVDVWQYPIAYLHIEPEMEELTQDKIEDNRGREGCPFADALLEKIDADDLFKHWAAQIKIWMGGFQNTVDKYFQVYRGWLFAGERYIAITDLDLTEHQREKWGRQSRIPIYEIDILNTSMSDNKLEVGEIVYHKGIVWGTNEYNQEYIVDEEFNGLLRRTGELSDNVWGKIYIGSGDWEIIDATKEGSSIYTQCLMSIYSGKWGVAPSEVEVVPGAAVMKFSKQKFDLQTGVSIDG